MTGFLRRLPDRARRPDLVAPAVGLVALLVYALHGFQGRLVRDIGLYAYAGQQLLEGDPPYVGVVNRAGPLAHMVPAVGAAVARLFGKDDLLGMRVLYMLFAVATVVVVYYVARDGFGSRLAGLVSAGAMLSFGGFIELATYGPREKTVMVFFMACALWAVGRRSWFLAGVFVSLATLVLQTGFPPAFAGVVVGLALQPRRAWLSGLGRVVAGGALPVLLLTGYFLAEGAVRDFLDGFLLLNANGNPPNPITDRLPKVWNSLSDGYGLSVWVMAAGVLALLVLAARSVVHRVRGGDEDSVLLLASAAGAVAAVLWFFLFDYDSWMDAFTLLPYAAVGFGALFAAVARHLAPGAWLAVASLTVAATLLMALTFSIGERNHQLVEQRSSTDAVLGALPEDARLLSLEAPQPLVLTERKNPTRHQMFSSGLVSHLDDTWPGGFPAFLSWLKEEQFEVVSIDKRMTTRPMPGQDMRWWRWLKEDYAEVGGTARWVWLVHESLGEDTIAAVRRAERRSG